MTTEQTLTPEEIQTLRDIAQRAISCELKGESFDPDTECQLTERLRTNAGAFVTLHLNSALRGCIGYIEPIKPLYIAVAENAHSAAFGDPRFASLTAEEFKSVDLEISVLTPPEPIDTYLAFMPGTHGIILKKNRSQAVFLPQVATEQGWDRDTTLTHLVMKAGMGPDDWRDDTSFLIFTAKII